MSIRQWKAAICQIEPCWLDKKAGVTRAVKLIQEAKENGASLIAFPEIWLPGYPIFIWANTYMENIDLVQEYFRNSILAHGPEILAIRKAAAEHDIFVGFGFSEKDGGSLYMAQMLIDNHGTVLMHRRKIKPTHMERTIFGEGLGDSLNNVVDTPLGKIGMLNCWEHILPLLKYNTFSQGEEVHIAAWPTNRKNPVKEPWSLSIEATEIMASQMYAIEGQTYVLCANSPVSQASIDRHQPSTEQSPQQGRWQRPMGGGAAAGYAPDGRRLTEPTDTTFDGILYCDIDLDQIGNAKAVVDTVGHYSRTDLLQLMVDDTPRHHVVKRGGNPDQYEVAPTLLSTHKPLSDLI